MNKSMPDRTNRVRVINKTRISIDSIPKQTKLTKYLNYYEAIFKQTSCLFGYMLNHSTFLIMSLLLFTITSIS